jgi:hypothetical protein
MARKDERDDSVPTKWSIEQLRDIVGAGMSIGEAKALLEEGYRPEDVLELAQLQAEQKRSAAASAVSDAAIAAANHTEKLHNPSNKVHPGISAFSYPEGDTARPRPVLAYEFLYNGYPFHKFPETQHWRELELASQVKPGEYKVMRKDYTDMKVSVTAERDADEKLEKVDVRFTVSREDKDKIPAQSVVLYQLAHAASGKPSKRLFLEAMTEWLSITLGADEAVAV